MSHETRKASIAVSRLWPLAMIVAAVAYPFAVYASVGRLEARHAALAMLALATTRAIFARQRLWWLACAGAACLAVATLAGDGWLPLKLYPVMVNAVLLAWFAASLAGGQSAIERIARLSEPDLPAAGVAYTRRLTQLWSAFFAVNGLVAFWTATAASEKVWALYNGVVAYLLIGALLGGEWLLRGPIRRYMERTASRTSMLELVASSRFRAAVIVPVFTQPARVGTLVLAAREAGLRCILVDDGSNAAGSSALDDMVGQYGTSVVAMRLQNAQGKGGAVMAGLRYAAGLDFSHAVQIDGEGQHDPMALGHFVALARRHPQALICGLPFTRHSAPLRRWLAGVPALLWTWATMRSLPDGPATCGFRVYPLATIVPMLNEIPLGTRMDFDTEVVVRAHWRGTTIISQRARG